MRNRLSGRAAPARARASRVTEAERYVGQSEGKGKGLSSLRMSTDAARPDSGRAMAGQALPNAAARRSGSESRSVRWCPFPGAAGHRPRHRCRGGRYRVIPPCIWHRHANAKSMFCSKVGKIVLSSRTHGGCVNGACNRPSLAKRRTARRPLCHARMAGSRGAGPVKSDSGTAVPFTFVHTGRFPVFFVVTEGTTGVWLA